MSSSNLAIFYRQFSALVGAGLPINDALSKLSRSEIENTEQIEIALATTSKGRPLYLALSKAGLCNRYQREIIRISEESGRLSMALGILAEQHEQQASRYKKAKSQLLLPFVVLIIAILISAIVQAVQPNAVLSSIAVSSALFLGLAILVTLWFANIARREAIEVLDRFNRLNGFTWYKEAYQQVTLSLILWQIKSGIDIGSAIGSTSKLFKSNQVKKPLQQMSKDCSKGMQLSKAIGISKPPFTRSAYSIVDTADQSGALDSALERFLMVNEENLRTRRDHAFAWLPRVYYCAVVSLILPAII